MKVPPNRRTEMKLLSTTTNLLSTFAVVVARVITPFPGLPPKSGRRTESRIETGDD